MQKIPKNSKILKNDGHFRIPHPQISLTQFSNICENVGYFFYFVGGWKNDKGFSQNIKFFKKIKNGQFSFFYILQLPHTVISNSEKLTHPTVLLDNLHRDSTKL